MRALLFSSLSASLAAALVGCPGEAPPAPTCSDYEPPAGFDPMTPAVSLSRDVMPLFKGSCAFTSCHGLSSSNQGVFLGSDAAKVHQGLVGVASQHLPSMPYVTAGDPRRSFLMRKLDGSQCALDAECVEGTCGDSMPRREELLPLAERDTIRRWIAQGAKND